MAGRCGCGRTCSCCTASTPSVSVSGAGSAGACYGSTVRYSTDANNRARAGTDGAVFADTCLRGPGGEAIEPENDGCLVIPAACVLDYNGDAIPPDESGCIQLPTAGPPSDFGCGLATDEEGALIVATSATGWPLEDLTGADFAGTYDEAGPVFCDPDGQLRTSPDHTALVGSATDTLLEPDLVVVAATYTSPGSSVLTITAPSPARRFVGLAFLLMTVDLVNGPNSGAEVRLQTRINGAAWTTARPLRWPELSGGTVNLRTQQQIHTRVAIALNPGQTWTLETRCQVVKTGAGDDPVVVSVESSSRVLGATV